MLRPGEVGDPEDVLSQHSLRAFSAVRGACRPHLVYFFLLSPPSLTYPFFAYASTTFSRSQSGVTLFLSRVPPLIIMKLSTDHRMDRRHRFEFNLRSRVRDLIVGKQAHATPFFACFGCCVLSGTLAPGKAPLAECAAVRTEAPLWGRNLLDQPARRKPDRSLVPPNAKESHEPTKELPGACSTS